MAPFASTWAKPGSESSSYLRPRSVRLRLLDGRTVEGRLHVADGQSVVEFLGRRRSFLNLTGVQWLDGRGGGDLLPHVGIRLSHVLWVVPLDPAFPLSSEALRPDGSRAVQLTLSGDVALQVRIQVADEQRVSDFFDACPEFVALRSVRIAGDADSVDRMAVQRDAILTIREI